MHNRVLLVGLYHLILKAVLVASGGFCGFWVGWGGVVSLCGATNLAHSQTAVEQLN